MCVYIATKINPQTVHALRTMKHTYVVEDQAAIGNKSNTWIELHALYRVRQKYENLLLF